MPSSPLVAQGKFAILHASSGSDQKMWHITGEPEVPRAMMQDAQPWPSHLLHHASVKPVQHASSLLIPVRSLGRLSSARRWIQVEQKVQLRRKRLPGTRTSAIANVAANDMERDQRPSNQPNEPKLQTTNGQCCSDCIPDLLYCRPRNNFRRKVRASRAKWR